MENATLVERLAELAKELNDITVQIAMQRQKIEQQKRQGADATASEALLTRLLETQRQQKEASSALLKELDRRKVDGAPESGTQKGRR
jgi:hypothetical protein